MLQHMCKHSTILWFSAWRKRILNVCDSSSRDLIGWQDITIQALDKVLKKKDFCCCW